MKNLWFASLAECLSKFDGDLIAVQALLKTSKRIIFIGNGGSAAIASHMAVDWSKNGGVPALCFNDAAALTCLGNDYGYEFVFERQLEYHAKSSDVLVAISSAGRSMSIRRGVTKAKEKRCRVVTLSGFDADNPLRAMGHENFYVPAHEYGHVEITHLAILHSMI